MTKQKLFFEPHWRNYATTGVGRGALGPLDFENFSKKRLFS